jgi:NAD-dependent SIR2 family protein deacetylase
MKDYWKIGMISNVNKAIEALKNADAILVGAGAGMSIPAGIDLMDREAFAKNYPAMVKYGFSFAYQLMGYPYEDDALRWGFLSASIKDMLSIGIDESYQKLLNIVLKKDYFILTSNVDRLFHKNNFNMEKIYTPQGDTSLFQCKTPCTNEVWDGVELIEEMVKHIDPETQRLTREDLIPRCPNCGGEIYMNVRSGSFYIEDRYEEERLRLNKWLQENINKKVVLLEIGVGYNTPGVIRYPFENLFSQIENCDLIRINPSHAEVPNGGISLKLDVVTALDELSKI